MANTALWICYALAVARLTTIVTLDQISAPLRSAILRRFDPGRSWHRWMAYLLGDVDDHGDGCPWCVSIWVGAATAPIAWYWLDRPWVAIPVIGLAASQITGMIHSVGRSWS